MKKSKKKKFYTADGILIKAGSRIFVPGPWIAHCERVERVDENGPISAYIGTVFKDGKILPEAVYSTKEAAFKVSKKLYPNIDEITNIKMK